MAGSRVWVVTDSKRLNLRVRSKQVLIMSFLFSCREDSNADERNVFGTCCVLFSSPASIRNVFRFCKYLASYPSRRTLIRMCICRRARCRNCLILIEIEADRDILEILPNMKFNENLCCSDFSLRCPHPNLLWCPRPVQPEENSFPGECDRLPPSRADV